MLRRSILGLIFTAVILCGARDTRWIRLHSANFEVFSSAGERPTRDVLAHFEQVRSFFLQTLAKRMTAEPVFIVVFGSKKEYEPYRFNEFATAYYHPTADRDYIVLSETGSDVFPVAVHEYVHLVVRHLNLNLPPWLNEGLAEFYSTLKPQGDKILVGSLIEGRYQALHRENWIALDTILSVNQDSPYYNEKDKAGGFYNESWALTHMLMMSEPYHAKIDQLFLALNEGQPSAEVLSRVYEKPIAAIERDLLDYLRGSVFHGAILAAKLQKGDTALPAADAGSTDVRLVLAQLMNRPGKEADARKEFEALTAADPKRFEPYAELGYIAWRSRNNDEARQFFHKAFDLGDRSPKMLWDYGRLAGTDFAEAVRVLSALVELQPDGVEARLALARAQIMARDAKAAMVTVAPIREVGRANAAQLFRTIAYAQQMLGNDAEARRAADRWLKESPDESEKVLASRFLAQLDRAGPPTDARPPAAQRPEDAPAKPSLEGSFVQLQCMGASAHLVLETAQTRKTFLIEDPSKIRVLHRDSGPAHFTCGPQQPPLSVRVEYDPPSTAAGAVDGILRTLEIR